MTFQDTLRLYALESRFECLKTIRMPGMVLPLVLFPLGFYLFFGVALGTKARGGYRLADYLIGTYGTFGVMSACLFGFGVGIAVERGLGWLQVKRAAPMPLPAYFVAKGMASALLCTVVIATLFTTAIAFGGVRMPVSTWLILSATLIAGSVPFCALGLAIGFTAGPNSAPGIVNAIYLPMAFASGLWMPLQALPEFMRNVAPVWPPYHLGQLALSITGQPSYGSASTHVLALAGFTLLFAAAAVLAYRRGEGKMYG
jgi:ABC-2 type transport system permease protein